MSPSSSQSSSSSASAFITSCRLCEKCLCCCRFHFKSIRSNHFTVWLTAPDVSLFSAGLDNDIMKLWYQSGWWYVDVYTTENMKLLSSTLLFTKQINWGKNEVERNPDVLIFNLFTASQWLVTLQNAPFEKIFKIPFNFITFGHFFDVSFDCDCLDDYMDADKDFSKTII